MTTVADLIEKLKQFPPDMRVVHVGDDYWASDPKCMFYVVPKYTAGSVKGSGRVERMPNSDKNGYFHVRDMPAPGKKAYGVVSKNPILVLGI
jgi:hypothetical protein